MAMDPSGSAMAQFDQATAVAGYAGNAGVPGGPGGMLPPQQQQQAGGGMDSPSILPPNFDVQVCEQCSSSFQLVFIGTVWMYFGCEFPCLLCQDSS
jgi:hypothetical protein